MTTPTITFPDNATIWATTREAAQDLIEFILDQETAFSAAKYDSHWAFNVMPGTWTQAHTNPTLQHHIKPGPFDVWVCKECGSADLMLDAMVGLNDSDNVCTYDNTYCDNCEHESDNLAKRVTVPADFDTRTDIYKEPAC